MIRNCPKCGIEILDPSGVTRSHRTYADCLRALLVEEILRHKKIAEIMQDEITKREQLEADFEKLAAAMKKDVMYDS